MAFQNISRNTRDTMVTNFIETIGNLQELLPTEVTDNLGYCNFNETLEACELIGDRLREEVPDLKALLMFTKVIIDRANK